MYMLLHTFKFLVLSHAESQLKSIYFFLLFLILELCYHILYCDLGNRFLQIRYCQNHNHITCFKKMEKQNWLSMPDTNIVILHHTLRRTNWPFFLVPLFLSEFSRKKNIMSILTAKLLFILLSKVTL